MWYFIETMHGIEAATVVAADGIERQWTSPKRLPKGHKLLPLLAECYHKKATVVDAQFDDDQLVVVHPVLGPERQDPNRRPERPEGDCYALHLWVGPRDQEPTSVPPAAGDRWILDQQCIHQTRDSYMMSGGGEREYLSVQQFTGRQLRSDGAAEVVAAGLAPTPDKKVLIDASIFNVTTAKVMPWLMICRGIDGNIMKILFYDVEQFGIEPKIPTPEALGLSALSAAVGRYAALAATLTTPSERRDIFLVMWLGETPPWFQETSPRSTDFIHPDDRAAFAAANIGRTDVAFAAKPTPIRIMGGDGEWHSMQAAIRPYALPGGGNSVEDLYIVEMWEH
ncbi:hypothetical protein AXK56_16325 [Tsukamurella pulmonis]|uniref:Rv3651-like N-terminal domain-containing protein n=1 Tax=Tsukamurella pulmonis TaxID=47312 RepID=A0A1H1A6Q4_9ACTN|nr:GAF domain-containing protein [Tsukamurella pulmonis]KXO95777.1 hypothetical protein AXK56_16325 [Tsukamurella pulmonis]SDQ35342.1 hypothetical protein SAMN04489765_0078 [Tsukamurella pulmonis]SUQ39460.1 Uncharacterised protein [Tsukamurella pulmonis]